MIYVFLITVLSVEGNSNLLMLGLARLGQSPHYTMIHIIIYLLRYLWSHIFFP